jgi:hypothetical protein
MTRLRHSTRLAAGFAAVGLLIASMAIAATPENGTVSKSNPKVEWGGDLTDSGAFYNAWAQDPSIPCNAPACDTFALTVAEGGHNLTLTENNDSTNLQGGGDPGCGMNIEFPDGSYQYTQAPCGSKTTLQVKLKNVKPGDYTVRVASSHVCCGTEGYTASAFIPEALTPAATPAPTPSGGGTTTSSPTAEAAPQLTVKATKASAKKLTKTHKYKITAEASGPINAVTAKLLKGSKTIGTAKLSRLSGKATMVLKLGKKTKVKKGKYKVTVSGTDDQGRVITTSVSVKVAK